jgi:hypothetical protein
MATGTQKEETKNKQQVPTKWEKSKCFKCQERWVPRHTKVCKCRNQIHLIAVEYESQFDTEGEANMGTDIPPTEEEGPEL